MTSTRIAIFGATGQAGRHITRTLLEDPSVEVTACARTSANLERLRASLVSSPGTLYTKTVDTASAAAVKEVAEGVDLVVGCTSQQADATRIASLAVASNASYFGLYMSAPAKWAGLRQLENDCLTRGLMVVDDGGTHPGLPAAMIRLAEQYTKLRSGWIGAKFSLNWSQLDVSPETIDDFATELRSSDPTILMDGEWVRGYRYSRSFDFGGQIGSESCVPMCLQEIRELGDGGSLESTGFFIAGFGPLVDYCILPVSMVLSRVSQRLSSRIMWWGLRRFTSCDSSARLVLEADPASGNAPIRMSVSHPDPYVLTAAPAIAAIRQMIDHPKPGVWTQAGFVDPAAFFDTLETLGVQVDRPA